MPELGRVRRSAERKRAELHTPTGAVRSVQRRVVVGAANDPLEHEAETTADAVVAFLSNLSARRVAAPASPDGAGSGATAGRIRRGTAAAATPQAVGLDGGEVDGELSGRIRRAAGRGTPLDAPTRERMEPAFGVDLGGVRIHRGAESADLNRALGAQAFTLGHDIHFGAQTPDLSSAAGTHLLAHELTHTVQQGGGHVRRLVDRAGLIAKAGAPHGNMGLAKRSVEYKALLARLDRYHAESDRVWNSGAAPSVVQNTLEPLLDQIATACWAYVREQGDDSDRTPHIRDVVNSEVPAERRRLTALTSSAEFAALDHTQPLKHVGTAKPAKVTNVGIAVSTTKVHDPQEGGTADCHQMNIWLEVDPGDHPQAPQGAPDGNVHGVTLEYWENVEIPYNFVTHDPTKVAGLIANGEGADVKEWNDILRMQPDSPTYSKVGGEIQMSWEQAVRTSKVGGVRAKTKVGFQDNPGVTPLAGKHIERILRFRIVVKDAIGKREIYATQIIKCDGGPVPVSMTYVDSLGNKVGKERAADAQTGGDVLADMDPADARLAAHDVTPAVLAAGVPPTATAAVSGFVRQLIGRTAAAFVNQELVDVRNAVNNQGDVTGPMKAYGRMGKKKLGTASDYYEIAGRNGLPYPENGTTYFQQTVGNGLLVGIVEGTTIRRMYYTPNVARPVGALQVNMRAFAEIPIESVEAYVPAAREYLKMSPKSRAAFDAITQAESAKVAAAATATARMGVVFRQGLPATLGYVRRHADNWDAIEREYDATQAPSTLAGALRTSLQISVHGTGPTAPEYLRLAAMYPHTRMLEILREAFIAELVASGAAANANAAQAPFDAIIAGQRDQLGAAPALAAIVTAHAADLQKLTKEVMKYLKKNRGKAPNVENDYNTVVPPLHLAGVPATLGEIVNDHFTAVLQGRGNNLANYARLAEDYPAFEYRLRPAFRFLFGEQALQIVTQRLRAAKGAATDPDAGSAANRSAKDAFMSGGPYLMADYGSAIEKAAKFDVAYDPTTQQLKVVIKLSFTFNDATAAPAKVKKKEAGKNYGQNAWTDEAKAKFKDEFRRNVLGVWNPNAPTIRCTRPGWEGIVAKPVFEIQEVAQGAGQHNNISATKAILADNPNAATPGQKPKVLKAQGVSAWGKVDTGLKEFDVADKISDPSVHQYLHDTERTGNIAPAYQTDNNRLARRLSQFGQLAFTPGNASTLVEPKRLQILVEEFHRLGIPHELTHLHALQVVGDATGGDVALGRRRANSIIRRLKKAGVENQMVAVAGPGIADAVTVQAAPADNSVVDTYVHKWARISAAHEFGHMLGLMDEYYGAKSDEVVHKMISDGVLPPGTRGDHLVANPPTDNVTEAKGQTETMKLLEDANLATPDFTLADNAKSSSLMTGGYELWPQHYVTVWEALAKLTEAEIGRKWWKLS